ncbi:histone acetyltransferase [Gurleya vavrai]
MIYKNEIDEEEDKNKFNEVYFKDLIKSQNIDKNNITKNTTYNNSEIKNTFKNLDLKENKNFISNKKNHNFLNKSKNNASNEDYKTFIKPPISYLKKSYKHLKHPIYLMTYADNYAIGYFKKNGFTSEITFKNWVGYIKDYDGGTMMQCKIYWEINYIKKDEFIERMKEDLIKKMSKKSEFNIIRKGIDVSLIKSVYDIPGLKEAKLSDEMLALKSDGEKLVDILKFLLNDLQSHSSAWPFLFPVKKSEVPDYYNFINKPMDLSTMEMKILKNEYLNVKMFSDDFFLIVKNCYKYNAATTQYYKCAQKLEDFFIKKLDSLNYNDK